MENKKKLVLFGPPGAGKGTFSSQIQKILPNIVHISTGDILRENVEKGTELGNKAQEYMKKGELVPSELINNMMKERLNREDVKEHGFILDGFPRNLEQANALSEMKDIDLFLLLEVPRELIKKRILGRFSCSECGKIYNKYTLQPEEKIDENKWICDKCGSEVTFEQRSDDTEETLEKRLDVYEENAKPVIEYYKEKDLLKKVDARNTLELKKDEIKDIIEL
jgi:adenylate kinase